MYVINLIARVCSLLFDVDVEKYSVNSLAFDNGTVLWNVEELTLLSSEEIMLPC